MSDELVKHLQPYREKINALDDKIIDLLEKRIKITTKVGEIKRKLNIETYAILEREVEIIRRLQDKKPLLSDCIAPIYREIISTCIAFERPTKISFLGPNATFSHEMALKIFGTAAQYNAQTSITKAIEQAESNLVDFAVVPFENSSAGTIGESLDQLSKTPLIINGESTLRIHHHLLANAKLANTPLSKITAVYAHPQPLEQCRHWLTKHLPNADLIATTSTAAAAKMIKEKKEKWAAIGSSMAANHYQLTSLAKGIEDSNNNCTRFLILGNRHPQPTGKDKTSFIVASFHEAGSMNKLLTPLAEHNINMTKLESRPAPNTVWEYFFYIDVEGHQDDSNLKKSLKKIKNNARFFKLLGSYPQSPD